MLNMLKIKCDINQQDLKQELAAILSNLNNFHSLEVMDRVSTHNLCVLNFNLNMQALHA